MKEQPFIGAGFAIPEGALFSGFHCTLLQRHRRCQHSQLQTSVICSASHTKPN